MAKKKDKAAFVDCCSTKRYQESPHYPTLADVYTDCGQAVLD